MIGILVVIALSWFLLFLIEKKNILALGFLPLTKRLKQLFKALGEFWYAISPIQEFICFNNGLGVTIESVDGKHKRHVQYPDQIQINFE